MKTKTQIAFNQEVLEYLQKNYKNRYFCVEDVFNAFFKGKEKTDKARRKAQNSITRLIINRKVERDSGKWVFFERHNAKYVAYKLIKEEIIKPIPVEPEPIQEEIIQEAKPIKIEEIEIDLLQVGEAIIKKIQEQNRIIFQLEEEVKKLKYENNEKNKRMVEQIKTIQKLNQNIQTIEKNSPPINQEKFKLKDIAKINGDIDKFKK